MTSTVEKEGCNRLDRFAIEFWFPDVRALGHVNYANDDSRHSWPFVAPSRIEDRTAVCTDPTQTCRTRVSLTDGVRRD